MKYENPEACSQALQQEFFNIMLKMMTQMNKPVRAEELNKVLKYAKKAAAYCSDVVRNDIRIIDHEEASKFWNQVYHINTN